MSRKKNKTIIDKPEDSVIKSDIDEVSADTIQNSDSVAEKISEEETSGEKRSASEIIKNAAVKAETTVINFINNNNVVARFIGIFLIFSSVVFIVNYNKEEMIKPFGDGWKDYCSSVNFLIMVLAIAISFFAVSFLKSRIKRLRDVKTDSYILAGGVLVFGVCMLWRAPESQFPNTFGMIAIASVLLVSFAKHNDFNELEKIPNKVYIGIMIVLGIGTGAFMAVTTVCRHKTFGTAVYDMGIFVQMYHSMITDFSLVTTCERENPISHFAVHFSPIFYTLYPFYKLFPKPETLLIAQAFLAASGFVPTYLICRKYKFSNVMSFMFSLVYIFSTSVLTPCNYDFHENAFLPPLLMWFFYAIEKKKIPLIYIMAILVLMVKEDAAFYVMCAGLYMFFSGKNKRHGIVIFLMAVAVFSSVLYFLSSFGEGAMTNRTFGNLMQEYDGGFGDVIKTALSNPMYFISECFKEEKVKFVLIMLMPLMFMPFVTKKPSHLLLVIPFLVTNLASGYVYASKFDFQYVFGTSACLIYAALINISDLDEKNMKRIIPLMALASVFMFTANDTRCLANLERYLDKKDEYDRRQAILELIPEDASVLTTSFQQPHVANRKESYVFDAGNATEPNTCDFVVIDITTFDDWKQDKIDVLREEGYEIFAKEDGLTVIFVSPDYEFKK